MAERILGEDRKLVMIQGAGSTVNVGPINGNLTLAYTTVDELEVGTLVGPIDFEVVGAALYKVSKPQ